MGVFFQDFNNIVKDTDSLKNDIATVLLNLVDNSVSKLFIIAMILDVPDQCNNVRYV